MKFTVIIFLFTVLFLQKTNSQSYMRGKEALAKGSQTKDFQNKFEILKIDSIEQVYTIYAKRGDSIIKIVSKKENLNDCDLIVKGGFYDLKIKSLFVDNFSMKRDISGIKYGGIIVKLEGDQVIWDLFVCENLKGLCFIESCPSSQRSR